jgi:hypothetical protein
MKLRNKAEKASDHNLVLVALNSQILLVYENKRRHIGIASKKVSACLYQLQGPSNTTL